MEPNHRWTSETMRAAIAAFYDGMPFGQVAREYKIPRPILRCRLIAEKPIRRLRRYENMLTVEQEKELCSRIMSLWKLCLPVTDLVLSANIRSICIENKVKRIISVKSRVWKKWLVLFLRRNPRVKTYMDENCPSSFSKEVMNYHFRHLRFVQEGTGLADKPYSMYSLACNGIKRNGFVAHEHATTVIVLSCGNAAGHVVPPMLLLKGKSRKPGLQDDLPIGTQIVMTNKGRISSRVLVRWFKHFAKYKMDGKTILILDAASLPIDHKVTEAAHDLDIRLLSLPTVKPHVLSPLHKSAINAFDIFWEHGVTQFWNSHPEQATQRSVPGKVFADALMKSMTPGNLKYGFKEAGVFPFNPSVIPLFYTEEIEDETYKNSSEDVTIDYEM